ncbi:response regulator transcription factor [Cohnella boryungensis]|uniref:Response regulator transcription factor n=1 Tax=Cohnella boryungensis TaxID=768479 RepID=A0ABV8SH44_9BACL
MNEQIHRILIVDDDEHIRRLLRLYLTNAGYYIDEAEDGEIALQKIVQNYYDLIILDLMLPGVDGIEVCTRLRRIKTTPVIILSAKADESFRLQGFDVGADDYVSKPFSPREVIVRVRAILQRISTFSINVSQQRKHTNKIVLPEIILDYDARTVTVRGAEIFLTQKEYDLLYFLAKFSDKVFSRESLLKEVWNFEFLGDLRTVDTHIKRLRQKLHPVSTKAAAMITTVWGVGYKLTVKE